MCFAPVKYIAQDSKLKFILMKKYSILLFTIPFLFTSCIKDDLEKLTDQGGTFLVAAGGTEKELFYNAFTDVRKIPLFDIHRNVPSNSVLNTPTTVKLKAAPEYLEAYNEEHETDYEWLPSEIFTFADVPGISVSGDEITLNYSAGDFAKEIAVNLDGAKWDLAHKYAMAYRISDPGNAKISDGNDVFITFVSAKNIYDGIYRYQTSENNTLLPNQDVEVQLMTVSPTKVKLYPGLLGYYSNDVWYIIDPVTNMVTVECPSLGVQEPQDTRSTWDPDTKTMTVFWKQGNGARTFEETFTYIKPR